MTNPNAANFSPVCLAKAPLWNARGYARAANVLTFEEIEAEAVARCTADGQAVVATAADYDLTANVGPDVVTRPNQPLDPAQLGLVRVSAVTFWETNWDPINMTTTDGSDTVWVNGMHIVTSTGRDIIVSRAEAKVECPGEEPTETVTPTDTETPEIPAACRPTPGNEPSGEIILGTNGPDAIAGTPRDDIICALDGDDLVDALDGDDLVILGRGDDEAEGGGGKDTIHGDEGNDSMSGGLFHDLLIGGAGDDQMKGNRGIDTLRGNKGADTLQGGAADDVLRGGSGNDSLRGYNGDDLLNGDKGVDQCIPGRGRDIMRNCERVRQPR
ncbi:MAG TPA: calcium-binding protein [Actinomycetota bacterium]|nr:calcium-binding protein [Actinomycetota bacterium]